jgi:hypothetical protein
VAAAAVAFGVYVVATKQDPGTSCALTNAAIAGIGVEVARGESAGVIIGTTIAGVLVSANCASFIKSLQGSTGLSAPVTLKGTSTDTRVPLSIFQTPAPTLPNPTARERACSGWTIQTYYRQCVNYQLPPYVSPFG